VQIRAYKSASRKIARVKNTISEVARVEYGISKIYKDKFPLLCNQSLEKKVRKISRRNVTPKSHIDTDVALTFHQTSDFMFSDAGGPSRQRRQQGANRIIFHIMTLCAHANERNPMRGAKFYSSISIEISLQSDRLQKAQIPAPSTPLLHADPCAHALII
jgi:hypothetical protein